MIDQFRGIMRDEIRQVISNSNENSLYQDCARRRIDRSYEKKSSIVGSEWLSIKFRVANIEFFHLDAFESYDAKFIIFAHKKTIYREVFIFVDRVNDYVYIVDEVAIRENLFFCFRGSTMT